MNMVICSLTSNYLHHAIFSLYLSSIISEKHESNEDKENTYDHEATPLLSNQKNVNVTQVDSK